MSVLWNLSNGHGVCRTRASAIKLSKTVDRSVIRLDCLINRRDTWRTQVDVPLIAPENLINPQRSVENPDLLQDFTVDSLCPYSSAAQRRNCMGFKGFRQPAFITGWAIPPSQVSKQDVALTGRNRSGPPCSVGPGRPTAHALSGWPGSGRPPTRPAASRPAGPPAGSVTDNKRRQTIDDDDRHQQPLLFCPLRYV